MSFDFLGYAFRPRQTQGKNGTFTGFDLEASGKAIARMSEAVRGWQLHRHVSLTWEAAHRLDRPGHSRMDELLRALPEIGAAAPC